MPGSDQTPCGSDGPIDAQRRVFRPDHDDRPGHFDPTQHVGGNAT